MKKTFWMALCMATVMLTSCANSGMVDYKEAHNYFHNNDVPLPSNPKITTQEAFEYQFGIAAFMGKGGECTPIDFSREFVLAKVLPTTDRQTDLHPVSLKKENGKLVLTYSLQQGAKQSFTTQPMFLLIVPKAYEKLEVEEGEE